MNAKPKGTETVSSQIKRFAIGGFPEDPTEVHPLLMPFWMKEFFTKLQASTKKGRSQRPARPPKLKMPWAEYFRLAKLTERQCSVGLLKYRDGLTTSAIARRLKIDRKTVAEHIQRVDVRMSQSRELLTALRKGGIPRS